MSLSASASKISGMWRVRLAGSIIDQFTSASRKTAKEWADAWNAATAPLPAHDQLNATAGHAVWRARD